MRLSLLHHSARTNIYLYVCVFVKRLVVHQTTTSHKDRNHLRKKVVQSCAAAFVVAFLVSEQRDVSREVLPATAEQEGAGGGAGGSH